MQRRGILATRVTRTLHNTSYCKNIPVGVCFRLTFVDPGHKKTPAVRPGLLLSQFEFGITGLQSWMLFQLQLRNLSGRLDIS